MTDTQNHSEGHTVQKKSRVPKALRWALYMLAALVICVVLVALLLQTNFGRDHVRQIAEQQIENALAPGTDVFIGRLRGNVFGSITLENISIEHQEETLASMDELQLDYRLSQLLKRRVEISDLVLVRPDIRAIETEDGSFTITQLFPDREETQDSTESVWTIAANSIAIQDGRSTIQLIDEDSSIVVDGIGLAATDFVLSGSEMELAMDELLAHVVSANRESDVNLSISGSLTNQHIHLASLRIESAAGTDISGTARVSFTSASDSDTTRGLPPITGDLSVNPLALSDVRAFSNLELYGDPRLRLSSHTNDGNLILAVQGSLHEGATISLDGIIEKDNMLRYRADGEVRKLNPSLLTRNDAHQANLNGDLRIDLAGTSLETLDGPFALALTDTRWGGQAIDRLRLDGSIQSGRIDFGLDSSIPGLDLHAEGNVRPFEESPFYNIRGTAADVNLAGLLNDPSQSTTLSGDFTIVGSGLTPDEAALSLSADLGSLRSGSLSLDDAQIEGNLRRGNLQFVAAAALANQAGTIDARGSMRPFDQPLSYSIDTGHYSNLNVSALTGNPEHASDITGSFTASGRGIDPQTLVLDLTTSVRDGYFDHYDLVAVDLDLRMNRGIASFDGNADLGRSGRLNVAGTVSPFAGGRPIEASGNLYNVDLAELLDNPELSSNITSTFSIRGNGTSLDTMVGTAELDLDYSSYGAQEVNEGQIVLHLNQGTVTVEGQLQTPEGHLVLDVTGRPFDEHPQFAIGEGMCFSSLDLATLTGNPAYRTSLSGCFTGTLNGRELSQASGGGVLTIRESRVNSAVFDSGKVEVELVNGQVDATGLAHLHSASTPTSRISLGFNGRPFDERPGYTSSGEFYQLDISSFLSTEPEQPIRLSATYDISGEGFDLETMRMNGRFIGEQSKLGEATLDTLYASLNIDRGVIQVDTLFLESDLMEASANGQLVLSDRPDAGASNFTLEADLFDLSAVNHYLEQPVALESGALRISVEGNQNEPLVANVRARAKRFSYGTTAVNSFASSITGSFDPQSGTFDVRSDVGFDFFSQPGILVEGGNIAVEYNDDGVGLAGNITLDRRRNVYFDSHLQIAEEASMLRLDSLQMVLDGTDWTLAQPTQISIGEEGYRVQTLLLLADDGAQQIVADGLVNPNGEQSFVLSIEGFNVESVADLIGFDGIGGTLSTDLSMSGPAYNPEIFGRMTVRDFTSLGNEVGELGVDIDYQNERLDLGAQLQHLSGRTLTAEGYLPLSFSLSDALSDDAAAISEVADENEVEFTVQADSMPIGWVRPFFNQRAYTHMEGLLNADLVINGTQADPQLEGSAELMNGAIGLSVAGRVFETLSMSLRFIGNQAVIEEATLVNPTSGRLKAEATGTITLPKLSLGELDLTVTPHRLLSMETRTYDGLVIDEGPQPIHLSGTLLEPVLRGSAVLSPATINMTEELVARDIEDVQLTQDDLRQIQTVFQRRITEQDTAISRFYKSLDLDIDVAIGRDVWLRSSSGLPFAVEFTGDVQAVKASEAEQTSLFGTVEVTRGYIETLSRRFEIERGTLVFNGLIDETMVDLQATLDIRTDPSVGTTAVEITLLAQGRLADDLTITLSSNPQLDNADIVSLIASGRLSEDLFGGGALVGTVEGLALSQLSGLLEGITGNALGLDVVQIDQEPGGLVIRLGKHLSTKAFVSLGQPISTSDAGGQATNNPQITFEYALLRWLLLQLEYEDGVGGGLIYEYAF